MPDYQKQNVQWFPGHMAKTRRQIQESLKVVDGVVEIVDARVPRSSSNPELSALIGKKPRIVILNKYDMADSKATKIWLDYYKKRGVYAFGADCRSGRGLQQFQSVCRTALAGVIKKNENKGMKTKPLRLMVVGIPNTGKSSFINRMAGKSKAEVANKAGVTRHNQWFSVGDSIELLDTPGVLWPKFDDSEVGDKLAFIGSVKAEVTDSETLACRLLDVIITTHPEMIKERYKLDFADFSGCGGYETLLLIGSKRGFLIKGGEIDLLRSAQTVCDEFKGGKLGKITLELP
ncbi:MAG: ribosome biogenesis GTPase YlqF [Clostridiales bacterium]|nr:ribosome biogenesis GTPase YlqF [Clostridiales bacterium]